MHTRYSRIFINKANELSHATRAKNVGQLSEEFPAFAKSGVPVTAKTWEADWKKRHPDHAEIKQRAIMKNFKKLNEMKNDLIDLCSDPYRAYKLLGEFHDDLMFVKTKSGLTKQEKVIKKTAEKRNASWRLATPEEESKGIDGWIGEKSVSVKPESYKHTLAAHHEVLHADEIIYYQD